MEYKMRSLEELLNLEDPGWPVVQEWMSSSPKNIEVLPPQEPARSEALVRCQITTRSPMGAIIYETGGIFVDDGWLRILGSGHERLNRSVPHWTLEATGNDVLSGQMSLIADDITGGVFALDAGMLGNPGSVFYFQPDSLTWMDMGRGYSDFIYFCFTADLDDFYGQLRWPGWRETHSNFPGNKTVCFTPPIMLQPIIQSQKKTIGQRISGEIPCLESFTFNLDLSLQLNGAEYAVEHESDEK